MTKKKPFWDVDENKGYRSIKASDNLDYKVWVGDQQENNQKKWWYNANNQQAVAETLARISKDINKIIYYLVDNEYLYNNDPIAFGIYHTFNLHIPDWNGKSNEPLFVYQEMRPNDYGILGLNKPKKIITIKAELDNNKVIDYELGKKRLILLTLRNQNNGELYDYSKILDLAIHELTHTTCNDVRWVPEWRGGNHREPYPTYHRQMRQWAKNCKVL